MADCTMCSYEYQCDWGEIVDGRCSHYRPVPDCQETEKRLDRKSLYIEIIRNLADIADLDVEGIVSITDRKEQTSDLIIMIKKDEDRIT